MMKNADQTGKCLDTMNYINGLFEELAAELPNVSIFDVRKAPFYDPCAWNCNIFREDLIHYLGKTNDWVAKEILKEYIEKNNKN
jgi:hypothetical protein